MARKNDDQMIVARVYQMTEFGMVEHCWDDDSAWSVDDVFMIPDRDVVQMEAFL